MRAARRRPRAACASAASRRARWGAASTTWPPPSATSSTSPGPTRCWSARTTTGTTTTAWSTSPPAGRWRPGRFGGIVGAYPVWFWADGPWRNAPVGGARAPAADDRRRPGAGAAPAGAVAGVDGRLRRPQAGRLRPLPLAGHEPDRRADVAGVPRQLDRTVPRPGRAVLPRRPGSVRGGGRLPSGRRAGRRRTGANDDGTGCRRAGRCWRACATTSGDDRPGGEVLGTRASSGATRHGVRRRGHDRHRQPRAAPGDAGHARLRPPDVDLRPLRAATRPHPGGAGPQQSQHRAVEHPGRGPQGHAAPAGPGPPHRRGREIGAEPALRRRQPGCRLLARRRPIRPPRPAATRS